jgi:hypothetical protein
MDGPIDNRSMSASHWLSLFLAMTAGQCVKDAGLLVMPMVGKTEHRFLEQEDIPNWFAVMSLRRNFSARWSALTLKLAQRGRYSFFVLVVLM